MEKIYNICKDFAENGGTRNLLLFGGVGLGKTHLSLAIAGEATSRGRSVIYGSAQNLINRTDSEYFSYSGSTEYIDGLLSCDILIIDDLGAEIITSFSKACVYNIVNTRIMRSKSTVINTNLGPDEFEKTYTPRVWSRVLGSYELLCFLGGDIRQKKKLAASNR